jgi:hypothetical protein
MGTMSDEATELMLYIENDSQIHHAMGLPIIKNLTLKKAKGVYEHEKALKAFLNLATFGAKNYHREHGSMTTKWERIFPMAARKEVASEMTAYFETEYRLGNFDNLLPKKYQKR